MLLTCTKLPLVFKTFVLFLSCRFRQVLWYTINITLFHLYKIKDLTLCLLGNSTYVLTTIDFFFVKKHLSGIPSGR